MMASLCSTWIYFYLSAMNPTIHVRNKPFEVPKYYLHGAEFSIVQWREI